MKKIHLFTVAWLISTALAPLEIQAAIPLMDGMEKSPNGGATLAPMLKEVTPAVVNVSTKASVRTTPNPLLEDPMFRQFFNLRPEQEPQEREVQSVGSGVIIDASKGYVLTNAHVVDDAKEVYVTLKDRRKIKAEVVGKDKETDIAVIKIKSDHLTAIKAGDSSKMEVGDFVVAIGNPFGLGQSVTSGIISAVGRNGLGIEGYENFIQTDAAINPGNSGGALVNLKGELIGINTAILSRSGSNAGIGFAIPVDMAMEIVQQLEDHGSIERGQLGIHIQDITSEIANAMGISAEEGALVAKVEKGSAAEKAGIKTGDVIVQFNSQKVLGAADLRNKVGLTSVGSKVTLEIIRNGDHKTITATIAKRAEMPKEALGSEVKQLKGAAIEDMPEGSDVSGVQVTHVDPDSPAAMAGIEPGDIITSVNQKKVGSVAEVIEAAKHNPKALLLNIQRGEESLFIVIQ